MVANRPRLKASVDYIVSAPELDNVGLVIHQGLSVLRCQLCGSYLTSGTITGHLDNHPPLVRANVIAAAVALCDERGIFDDQTKVILPRAMGPPVQGLPFKLGYACRERQCDRVLVELHAIHKHERDYHNIPSHPSSPPRPQVQVQTLFTNPIKYFAVNSSLTASARPDLMERLLEDFLPITNYSPPILTATDDRGRNSMEKHFEWDDLLLTVRQSRPALALLVSLKQAAGVTEAGGMYVRLASAVRAWYYTVLQRMTGHPVKYDLERAIIYGPEFIKASRYVFDVVFIFNHITNLDFRADRWIPVADHNDSYIGHHAEFMRCILRQLNGHGFPVNFPLTARQRTAFLELNALLRDSDTDLSENVAAVQNATWSMIDEASVTSWGNLHQVYWALLALRMDGCYASALALTPHLAKFHYMMRVACLFIALEMPANEAVA